MEWSSQFLENKSQIAASLASISSRENYIEKLQEAIQILWEEDLVKESIPKGGKDIKDAESYASNPNEEVEYYAQENEDDCYGINFNWD